MTREAGAWGDSIFFVDGIALFLIGNVSNFIIVKTV